jgi:Type IV secretion system pilin
VATLAVALIALTALVTSAVLSAELSAELSPATFLRAPSTQPLRAAVTEPVALMTPIGAAIGRHPSLKLLAVNDLPTIVNNVRTWLIGILAGLATLFLTIGGVRYLMAGGEPGEVERAKSAFRSAAIGYVLAIIAPVVLTILKSIVGG